MQLLPPTFDAWAVDGDGDGRLDPHDIDDAVATAAAYLCGPAGRIDDERAALRRYNNSNAYVDEVLAWAERYAAAPPLYVDAAGDAAALLAHPNVTIYCRRPRRPRRRTRGRPRSSPFCSHRRDHTITVTSLVTGHPRCAVTGQAHGPDCVVSNHYLGRGADIAVVDGIPISVRPPRRGRGDGPARRAPAPYRPDEIGGPIDTGARRVHQHLPRRPHPHRLGPVIQQTACVSHSSPDLRRRAGRKTESGLQGLPVVQCGHASGADPRNSWSPYGGASSPASSREREYSPTTRSAVFRSPAARWARTRSAVRVSLPGQADPLGGPPGEVEVVSLQRNRCQPMRRVADDALPVAHVMPRSTQRKCRR